VPGSVRLSVNGKSGEWTEIDDLLAAGSEVETADPALAPGQPPAPRRSADVFMVNAEAGEIRFGDGLRGRRPPEGASLSVTYDYSVGAAGNVEKGAIATGPALPAGIAVANPVRTWGGADPETVAEGERQVARHLQHRERLVTAEDFDTIARRAPGVQIGRLEVLPAFHPDLSPNEPGDAPGTVTLMVIPRHDPEQPDAPRPDRPFLDALCRHLDPRRLVTTELLLRGPEYVPIYVSVGIDVKAGHAVAEVREAVKRRLLEFLAPVYPGDPAAPAQRGREQGWPLRKAVLDRELMAEASRVQGVLLVNDALIARGAGEAEETIPITGIQLPRVLGISVQAGSPLPLDALRGQATDALAELPQTTRVVPVPFVPEEC
jgi:predicted phage baseplate assembly protein